MKSKKTWAIVLICICLLALCACGAPSGEAEEGSGEEAGQETSQETYTFRTSVHCAEGSVLDEYFVQPFNELLQEKSDGRMSLEVYYGSSLTQQGNGLDALKGGLADIVQDVFVLYPGQFLYEELMGVPGWNFGGFENFSRVANEYAEAFPDKAGEDYVVCARFAFSDFGLCTNKPVTKVEDVKGMMIRASSQIAPWYEAMGATGTFFPNSEMYESLRLNIVDGVHTSIEALQNFRLAEVSSYYTRLPMHGGASAFIMSKKVYDSLPEDMQAVLDDIFNDELLEIGINYAKTATEISIKESTEMNPNFQFLELDDPEPFVEAAMPIIEAKVKELNDAGLDGDGAYEWLMDHTVK